MKITPSTRKKKLLYPMAAAVVLTACQQQQQQGGVLPLPPEVCLVPAEKPQEKSETSRPQRLGGKAPLHMRRNHDKQLIPGRARANQPLPGKKRASR